MVFRARRFFTEPATVVFREAKFRQLLRQREMTKFGSLRQIISKRDVNGARKVRRAALEKCCTFRAKKTVFSGFRQVVDSASR